jgi:hypothetical protein
MSAAYPFQDFISQVPSVEAALSIELPNLSDISSAINVHSGCLMTETGQIHLQKWLIGNLPSDTLTEIPPSLDQYVRHNQVSGIKHGNSAGLYRIDAAVPTPDANLVVRKKSFTDRSKDASNTGSKYFHICFVFFLM